MIVHIDNTKLGPRASQQERQCNWPTMTALIKAVQLQGFSHVSVPLLPEGFTAPSQLKPATDG